MPDIPNEDPQERPSGDDGEAAAGREADPSSGAGSGSGSSSGSGSGRRPAGFGAGGDAGSGAGEPPQDPLSQLFAALGGAGSPGGPAGFGGLGGAGGGLPDLGAFGDLGGLAGAMGGAGLPEGMDPAKLIEQLSNDPAAMAQVMAQVQQLMAHSGDGPVNWELARDLARQAAAAGGDPSVSSGEQREVVEALRLADLWLDPVTDLPSGARLTTAWSRSEWVEATLPVWRRLAEPVAASVADAMAAVMTEQAPEEMKALMAGTDAVLRSVGGAVFGMQLGQAVGGLAREVVSATDVGLPLTTGSTAALVPANVADFAEGLGIRLDEVRLFLAVREAAHARLFAHVPWLRGHLLGAVEAYARGITIDTDRIEEAVRSVDPSDPQALQQALSSGMFEPQRTPAQQVALDRLETALALVEGWVDELVDAACGRQLPSAVALREAVRRRRASGGPAEHVLASLVGLELRPRRLRDAARLWSLLGAERGASGRDAVWAHPDLLPTAADLDDPDGYVRRRAEAQAADADVDAALEQLLRGDGDGGASGAGDGEPGDGEAPPARP